MILATLTPFTFVAMNLKVVPASIPSSICVVVATTAARSWRCGQRPTQPDLSSWRIKPKRRLRCAADAIADASRTRSKARPIASASATARSARRRAISTGSSRATSFVCSRPGKTGDLHLQYSRGEASLLSALRGRVVLYRTIGSRQNRYQRTMRRGSRSHRDDFRHLRRAELGSCPGGASKRASVLDKTSAAFRIDAGFAGAQSVGRLQGWNCGDAGIQTGRLRGLRGSRLQRANGKTLCVCAAETHSTRRRTRSRTGAQTSSRILPARRPAHTAHSQSAAETWVAFGPSPRGYKRYGYLALCISRAGLHVRAVVKSEADSRLGIARQLRTASTNLVKDFEGTSIARYETWDFARLPMPMRADAELFDAMAATLGKKTGWIDLGFGWNVRDSLRLDRAEVIEAFHELEPLYRLFQAVA